MLWELVKALVCVVVVDDSSRCEGEAHGVLISRMVKLDGLRVDNLTERGGEGPLVAMRGL